MKNRVSVIYISMFLILAGSCKLGEDDNQETKNGKLLSSPPFDVITDSIKRFPKNAALYLKRGELLTDKELHQLAYPDYRKAWELKPDETTAFLYSANLFLTGREHQAIKLLEQCQTKFPSNPDFSRRLSEAYMQSGRSEQALSQYTQMLEKDPGNFEAWYEKGLLLAQSKDTAGAIHAMEKAYELQPLQSFGVVLANLYAETKDKKVISLCDELIQKDSAQELTDALFIKGIYYTNINEKDKALEQFGNCIKRDWKFTEAYIEKGIIFFQDKNIDEALKTFALAAKVSNTYADAYFWMARCFETIGKMEEAKENYHRALALDRNFIEAKRALQRLK